MGYRTYFTLETTGNLDADKFDADFEEQVGIHPEQLEHDNLKWYDYDADMLMLSKLHPKVLFTLWGNGEEDDDYWVAYFYEGNMQHCPAEVTYPSPDYSALGNVQRDLAEHLI